ncbi:hypothetical protein [Arthrobacter sp. CAN_C5]|uniref:hypothetical protein n=1 Tax=Arthrobacter sp. CAN_C5 TaxID=2760706 RepID=UPI001AE6B4B4|nr:hypothetical protein [Arthrobacter sp. CAN_C5]MBP2216318.1 hypothetical protein [Arthrobacter sp. CAN_C5]
MLTLYSINRVGHESGLVRDVPDEAHKLAGELGMQFFDRANSTLYGRFPSDLAAGLYQKLAEYGITWYTESDWLDYRKVRSFMAAYYPGVAA